MIIVSIILQHFSYLFPQSSGNGDEGQRSSSILYTSFTTKLIAKIANADRCISPPFSPAAHLNDHEITFVLEVSEVDILLSNVTVVQRIFIILSPIYR